MAKSLAPLLSFEASGTVGKSSTYSKWKGRKYVKRYSPTPDPKTVPQVRTYDTFALASSIWKVAPQILRDPWDLFAKPKNLTARNAWIGRFIADNRPETDLDQMTFSPGANGGLAPPNISTIVDVQFIQIACDTPDTPQGWTRNKTYFVIIKDQNPQSGTDFETQVQTDQNPPLRRNFDPVDTGVVYQCGCWIQWTLPSGIIAYSQSLLTQATPL